MCIFFLVDLVFIPIHSFIYSVFEPNAKHVVIMHAIIRSNSVKVLFYCGKKSVTVYAVTVC